MSDSTTTTTSTTTANAVQRLLNADNDKDIKTVLMEEPSLLTDEADEMLKQYEEAARQDNDSHAAGMLGEIRDFLRDMRTAGSYEPPDVPGSMIAFELIHALLVAAPRASIPRSALDGIFFATLESMRQHATQNKLTQVRKQLAGIEKRIAVTGSAAQPVAPGDKPSVFDGLAIWLDTALWSESRVVLAEHPELLSSDVLAIVKLLARGARAQGDEETAVLYDVHVNILKQARTSNLDEAYKELLEGEQAELDRQQTERERQAKHQRRVEAERKAARDSEPARND